MLLRVCQIFKRIEDYVQPYTHEQFTYLICFSFFKINKSNILRGSLCFKCIPNTSAATSCLIPLFVAEGRIVPHWHSYLSSKLITITRRKVLPFDLDRSVSNWVKKHKYNFLVYYRHSLYPVFNIMLSSLNQSRKLVHFQLFLFWGGKEIKFVTSQQSCVVLFWCKCGVLKKSAAAALFVSSVSLTKLLLQQNN